LRRYNEVGFYANGATALPAGYAADEDFGAKKAMLGAGAYTRSLFSST